MTFADVDRVDVNTGGGADSVTLTDFAVESVIHAGAGNDTVTLNTLTANSTVYAGDGNDTVSGEATTVAAVQLTLFGEQGDDNLIGADGPGTDAGDRLYGGEGNDRLEGGTGQDWFFGGAGNDLLVWVAGDGSDLMEGGTGDDWISGTQSMRAYLRGAEIAGVMGISVEAVESLTARGKRTLAAILAGRRDELGYDNG